eukprot:5944544-Prymnesium_polylepis.1
MLHCMSKLCSFSRGALSSSAFAVTGSARCSTTRVRSGGGACGACQLKAHSESILQRRRSAGAQRSAAAGGAGAYLAPFDGSARGRAAGKREQML